MNGNKLLDTNIVIAYFEGDSKVEEKLRALSKIILPCIVLGELFFGAQKSRNVKANIARIETLKSASTIILSCDDTTARQYGVIRNELRLKGRPIPENDIWIAALATQHNLTLITRDAHFGEVPNLAIEKW